MSKEAVRIFPGSANRRPDALLRWLNFVPRANEAYLGRPTKSSRARVIKLLREVNETIAMLAISDREDPNFDFFDFEHKTITPRVKRIQELLEDYPKWPTVEIAYNNMSAVLRISDASRKGRPLGEQTAVWDIARLTDADQLGMVRQCLCKTWFFARRMDQKVCSPLCRHKTYEQTDAFKAKRRAYMRDYYKLKQSGKVK